MENNKKRNPSVNGQNPFICALIGGGISFCVILLTALIFPIAALKMSDPKAMAMPISCVCAFMGAVTGSFVSAKKCGHSAIQAGLMSAGITVLPMALVSLIVPGNSNFVSALVIIGIIVSASLLGAYAVTKINGNRKRNMKKVMKRRQKN